MRKKQLEKLKIREQGVKDKEGNDMRRDKKTAVGLFEKLVFRIVVHSFNAVYLKEKWK